MKRMRNLPLLSCLVESYGYNFIHLRFLLFAVVATGHLEAGRLNAHVPPIGCGGIRLHSLPSEQILKCWWFSSLVRAEKDTL